MEGINRFIKAQRGQYEKALSEIRNGKKKTHWMWYMFPQIKGLGYSKIAKYYEIQSIEEAVEYVQNGVLLSRLSTLCIELLNLPPIDVEKIFGSIDSVKLQSSMTLFYRISGNQVFKNVLDKFFKGQECQKTIEILKEMKIQN